MSVGEQGAIKTSQLVMTAFPITTPRSFWYHATVTYPTHARRLPNVKMCFGCPTASGRSQRSAALNVAFTPALARFHRFDLGFSVMLRSFQNRSLVNFKYPGPGPARLTFISSHHALSIRLNLQITRWRAPLVSLLLPKLSASFFFLTHEAVTLH